MAGEPTTPLLGYAAAQNFPQVVDQRAEQRRLTQLQHMMARDPPPGKGCAHILGAGRFAALYDDLGSTYSALGKGAEAAAAFAQAVDCKPRAAYLHARLADELLRLGRFEDAKSEARRQSQPQAGEFTTASLLARAAFSEQQWPEAIGHLRRAVSTAPDDVQATYFQCLLWLAQKRAGTSVPMLVAHDISRPWPRPILEFLQDRISEDALVQAIAAEHDEGRRREMLCEALFYAGEKHLAAHRASEARRYFEAAVHLQVFYFIEDALARAELGR